MPGLINRGGSGDGSSRDALSQTGRRRSPDKIYYTDPRDDQAGADSTRPASTLRQATAMLAAARPVPLLVCSVGNPGSAYANTLHSAGHTIVKRLAEELGYPAFHKDREWGNGLVTRPPHDGQSDWTLWQSTAYMNESGKGVRAAHTAWSRTHPGAGQGRLVIIHDELEKPLGAVSLRTALGASAKGHNGLKSIMAAMGNAPLARIGIGIGRPASRDSDDVARYVLRKMTSDEKKAIEGSLDQVIAKLKELGEG